MPVTVEDNGGDHEVSCEELPTAIITRMDRRPRRSLARGVDPRSLRGLAVSYSGAAAGVFSW